VVQVAAQEQPLVGAAAEEEEPHESSQRLVNGQGVDRSSAHGVDDEGVAGIDPAPRSAYSDA
jgi:hypothetical protein